MNNLKFPIQLCKHTECTGCEACRSICPVGAIKMQSKGKLLVEIPIIDQDLCIQCHSCEKVCPVFHPVGFSSAEYAFAAIARNETINNTSSSGGIAAVIANWYIENNGTVYGVISEGREFFHKRCSDLNEIELLKGSKYVKSNLRNTYSEVRRDLKDRRQVVFFGTPCQIAGLRNFLGISYENLLTVDLICHGTPSQELLKTHLNSIVQNKKVSHIVFREDGFHMRIYSGDKVIYDNDVWKAPFKDVYYTAFCIACSTFRDSCYKCSYATPYRTGDLTIGDFWGLSKDVKFSRIPSGISVVLPNTNKGKTLITIIGDRIEKHNRPIEEAINGNAQLRSPSKLSLSTKIFRSLFDLGISLKSSLLISYFPKFIYFYLKRSILK